MDQPSLKQKILFWIILGALSTFFAEVVAGSSQFPFFTLDGILIVFAVYSLHILVLSHILFNYGKPGFHAVFLSGMIFGMYEAYITKVLWAPGWGDATIVIGGVALVEFLVLVFFWHPLMAFMAPLFFAEALTSSGELAAGLPGSVRNFLGRHPYASAVTLAALAGFTKSLNSPSPEIALLSCVSNIAVVAGLAFAWSKTVGRKYALAQLLPDRKQGLLLLAALLALYVILGSVMNIQNLPGFGPQVLILAFYAVLFLLLFLSLKKQAGQAREETGPIAFPARLLLVASLVFTLTSIIAKPLLGQLLIPIVLLTWAIAVPLGLLASFLAIRDAISSR